VALPPSAFTRLEVKSFQEEGKRPKKKETQKNKSSTETAQQKYGLQVLVLRGLEKKIDRGGGGCETGDSRQALFPSALLSDG